MGAKPGRMKGNIQEAKYRKPEKKQGETLRRRRWRTGKPKGGDEALGKPLRGGSRKLGTEESEAE